MDVFNDKVKSVLREGDKSLSEFDWQKIEDLLPSEGSSYSLVGLFSISSFLISVTNFFSRFTLKPVYLLVAACLVGLLLYFTSGDPSSEEQEETSTQIQESFPEKEENNTPILPIDTLETAVESVEKDTLPIVAKELIKPSVKIRRKEEPKTEGKVSNVKKEPLEIPSSPQPPEQPQSKPQPKPVKKNTDKMEGVVEEFKSFDAPRPTITFKKPPKVNAKEGEDGNAESPSRIDDDIKPNPVEKPQSFKEVK